MDNKTLNTRYNLVSKYIHNQTNEEWEKLTSAILATKNIRIPFSESDIQDLQSGESHDWCFEGVHVYLFPTDYNCATCDEEIEKGCEHEGEDGEMYCINCEPT
jgi:hypothetical protein